MTTNPKTSNIPNNGANSEEMESLAKFAKEQAKAVLAKVPLLGPVTWLMMQQSATRHTLLSELEWRVMPALVLDQAKIYMRENAPIAFVSWAKLSDAAAARYKSAPHQLVASDWRSGEQVWLIDLFVPFGGGQEVISDLQEKVFPGQEIRQLAPAADGLANTLTWPALSKFGAPDGNRTHI